jgi:hypothetical protein
MIHDIILLVTFYGCETIYFFSQRELHRLRISEEKVLRRTFGPKRGEK